MPYADALILPGTENSEWPDKFGFEVQRGSHTAIYYNPKIKPKFDHLQALLFELGFHAIASDNLDHKFGKPDATISLMLDHHDSVVSVVQIRR